jgi:hypothetical protein
VSEGKQATRQAIDVNEANLLIANDEQFRYCRLKNGLAGAA